jgi:hypothetical protein
MRYKFIENTSTTVRVDVTQQLEYIEELVGYPCVATAHNNTHVNYPQKDLNIFIDCLRSPYNIFFI